MNHSSTCAEGTLCLEIEEFGGEERQGWNDAPLAGESRTILLVEDETFVREVASEVLRASGYRVLTAKSAAEAMQIYENGFDIDLLLTDVVLPGETGRVLAEKLRRANPRLPVLLATGYGEQMVGETSEECLAKPFSSEDLLRRVRQLLEKAPWRLGPIHAGLRRRVACRI
ncbi:MAG TPA: response regulator [Candidatus Sulfotelmatobacter sp.]|nr:response regulator [Candidatus Sulfotelmatobacter sp.]